MAINPETHAPPIVLFAWGELTFTACSRAPTQRFTMFLDSGVPVRAQLQVTFNEWTTADRGGEGGQATDGRLQPRPRGRRAARR